MSLPFTVEEFLAVFRRYNEAVWPAQWLLSAAGVAAVWLAVAGHRDAGRWVMALLAALWVWMGVVYHLVFFRPINPAAMLFGVAFVAQGALLAWLAIRRETRCRFRARRDLPGVTGAIFVTYALVVYPALALLLGHRYPDAPTFGLPCPTTILTLGVLLWASPRMPWSTFVIPLLWTAIGTSAAVQLGMLEDLGLLVAGIACVVVMVFEHRPHVLKERHR